MGKFKKWWIVGYQAILIKNPKDDRIVIYKTIYRVMPVFAWYDLWVGLYYDRKNKTLYVLPIPMIGFKIYLNTN